MGSTQDNISYATYIISIYFGSFVVIAGLIGNIINILVFTQLKLFRGNQSAFYLTVIAIFDCFELIFATGTRIIAASIGFDPTQTSVAWCKIRVSLVQLGGFTSAIALCFAAIDQYLSTSYHNRLRQMSTFKLAQRLIGILIAFSVSYAILPAIFYEIGQNYGCAASNATFNYYYAFVHLCVLLGILPIVISSLFSILAYRNTRRIVRRQMPIVRRRLDRQLTAMILVQVTLFDVATLPYVIYRTYKINNPIDQNNTLAVAIDQLITTIINIVYNINHSGGFYAFLATSARFRRQVKYLFKKGLWRKCLSKKENRNQVAPENQQQNVESHASSAEAD